MLRVQTLLVVVTDNGLGVPRPHVLLHLAERLLYSIKLFPYSIVHTVLLRDDRWVLILDPLIVPGEPFEQFFDFSNVGRFH